MIEDILGLFGDEYRYKKDIRNFISKYGIVRYTVLKAITKGILPSTIMLMISLYIGWFVISVYLVTEVRGIGSDNISDGIASFVGLLGGFVVVGAMFILSHIVNFIWNIYKKVF